MEKHISLVRANQIIWNKFDYFYEISSKDSLFLSIPLSLYPSSLSNERALDEMGWDVKPKSKSIDGYNIFGPLVIFCIEQYGREARVIAGRQAGLYNHQLFALMEPKEEEEEKEANK